ncbi:hypothetical protein L873DRAFT_156979 [Choiromyces venosus 120613-1]|uniref:C2H2-type domain-containing protein n=1 Tax=Choiromyces venosus 120613-1 TaxID=1336337 RepID=A0A3N4J2R8_9PEZI|nr:hypothetical protein L873DRAFT_156979 [Choiromyces venosus 120613-1]
MLASPLSKHLYNTTPTAYPWFTKMDHSRGGLAPNPATAVLSSLMQPANTSSRSQQFDPNRQPVQHPDASYTINPHEDPQVLDPSYSLNSRHYYENESDSASPSPVRSPIPHNSSEDTEQHPCLKPDCSKIFSHLHKLQRHYRDAHGKPQYDCPFPSCTRKGAKGFSRRDNMRQHHRLVHNKPLGPSKSPEPSVREASV